MCELLFLATIAAFLAFVALKVQNTEFCKLMTPNGLNHMKKSLNCHRISHSLDVNLCSLKVYNMYVRYVKGLCNQRDLSLMYPVY